MFPPPTKSGSAAAVGCEPWVQPAAEPSGTALSWQWKERGRGLGLLKGSESQECLAQRGGMRGSISPSAGAVLLLGRSRQLLSRSLSPAKPIPQPLREPRCEQCPAGCESQRSRLARCLQRCSSPAVPMEPTHGWLYPHRSAVQRGPGEPFAARLSVDVCKCSGSVHTEWLLPLWRCVSDRCSST